jgi:hypothetical protein
VLLTRVVHVNIRPDGRRFLVLDAGMNDLLRPAMYDAYHDLDCFPRLAAAGVRVPRTEFGPADVGDQPEQHGEQAEGDRGADAEPQRHRQLGQPLPLQLQTRQIFLRML